MLRAALRVALAVLPFVPAFAALAGRSSGLARIVHEMAAAPVVGAAEPSA